MPINSSTLISNDDDNNLSTSEVEDAEAESNRGEGAVWKRRFYALKETVDAQKTSKRKLGNATATSQLGRGIRKVVFLCGEIKALVSESDKHLAYMIDQDDEDLNAEFEGLDDEEVYDLKRTWERSYNAVHVLKNLIPNFEKKIDEGSPEELSEFYAELQRGADGARSDDLNRIRTCIADWLNSMSPRPEILLDSGCRKNRGIEHDTTGRLLCPIEFDWDNLVTRAKLRAGDEEFDWLSSYHSRCFYSKYSADAAQLESGYLKSSLLVQVFKAIFTSPSSARGCPENEEDEENTPPARLQKTMCGKKAARRNVASKVHLNNKVTPRSIAYAAVQLHFNLQSASSWSAFYGGFDYQGLYNYVVDFFEDTPGPAAKKCIKELLDWWCRKVFPDAAVHRQSNTSTSRKSLRQQRAALEHKEVSS